MHLDYELFVYELSCLTGQLEETSIVISSVYKAELLKSLYFSHVCTAAVFKNIHSVKRFAMCSTWTPRILLAPGMLFQDRRLLRSGPLGQCVHHTPLVNKLWVVVPE